MLSTILTIYLLITILFCFFRIKVGLMMFLIYIVIVPFVKFLNFGVNFLNLILIVAVFFQYKVKSLDFTPLKPFIFLYGAQLIMIPFHSSVPIDYQLSMIRSDFMSSLLLPFAIHNVMHNDKKTVSSFTITMLCIIIVTSGYSLFLTTMAGFNPYMLALLPLNDQEFNDVYALASDGGRVFGRISGVFTHPMINGLFLAFSFIFIISKLNLKKLLSNKLLSILLFVVFITILLIGVRSAIVALGIGVVFYLLIEKKINLILASLLGLSLIYFVALSIPGMSDYMNSIVDPESSNVKGSSIEMRLEQFDGCMKEIESNPAFGKGYAWTNYYKENKGGHPTMLSFESLFIVILSNSGFVGLFIWIVMLIMYYKLIKKNLDITKFRILLALMLLYISYSMITGEYGYLRYFTIFYILIWNSELNYFKSKRNV